MNTFSAYWHDGLESALQKAIAKHDDTYLASLVGDDAKAMIDAVNQGIDSRLEAVTDSKFERKERSFTATEDSKFWKKGDRVVHQVSLHCEIAPKDLPVIIRRLLESDDDAAISLAIGICETLGIELV